MVRKCGGGEGQRTGGFHVAQRVGMIAGSAEIQDFGHTVGWFFFIHLYTVALYAIVSLHCLAIGQIFI